MSKGLAAGRVLRWKQEPAEHCLALSGKGAPGATDLEEAIEALGRAADALRDPRLRGAHPFDPGPPEVRLRAPAASGRGGLGWTVFVRVPSWVGIREATMAIEEASWRNLVAKNIRLSPVLTEPTQRGAPPGRDRQPGQIRRRRVAPQHRARELR